MKMNKREDEMFRGFEAFSDAYDKKMAAWDVVADYYEANAEPATAVSRNHVYSAVDMIGDALSIPYFVERWCKPSVGVDVVQIVNAVSNAASHRTFSSKMGSTGDYNLIPAIRERYIAFGEVTTDEGMRVKLLALSLELFTYGREFPDAGEFCELVALYPLESIEMLIDAGRTLAEIIVFAREGIDAEMVLSATQ